MRYNHEGVEYEMTFRHFKTLHPRTSAVRHATELTITGPSKATHLQVTVLFNPEGREKTWGREIMRQAAIERLGQTPGILPGEYVEIRRAYFLRRRKTRAQKLQTRLFHRELKSMMGNGNLPKEVRESAQFLYAYEIAKASIPAHAL